MHGTVYPHSTTLLMRFVAPAVSEVPPEMSNGWRQAQLIAPQGNAIRSEIARAIQTFSRSLLLLSLLHHHYAYMPVVYSPNLLRIVNTVRALLNKMI